MRIEVGSIALTFAMNAAKIWNFSRETTMLQNIKLHLLFAMR